MTVEQASDLLEIASTLNLGARLLTEFGSKYPDLSENVRSHLSVVTSGIGLARRQLDLVRGGLVPMLHAGYPQRD